MAQPPKGNNLRAIPFGEKMASSVQFQALFDEGMDLAASAAAYLDGEGRSVAKRLSRAAAIGYTIESMRLTTRLMQVAAWLLLQRAVNEGELTRAEAAAEKCRTRLAGQDAVSEPEVLALLPQRLGELIESSLRLHARVTHLDALLYKTGRRGRGPLPPNPVVSQIEQVRSAFAQRTGTSP